MNPYVIVRDVPCSSQDVVVDKNPRRHRPGAKRIHHHIPRPKNCWILFLQDYSRRHGENDHAGGARSLTKEASKIWKSMTDVERQHWKSMQDIEKEEHSAAHEGYKYKPNRKRIAKTSVYEDAYGGVDESIKAGPSPGIQSQSVYHGLVSSDRCYDPVHSNPALLHDLIPGLHTSNGALNNVHRSPDESCENFTHPSLDTATFDPAIPSFPTFPLGDMWNTFNDIASDHLILGSPFFCHTDPFYAGGLLQEGWGFNPYPTIGEENQSTRSAVSSLTADLSACSHGQD